MNKLAIGRIMSEHAHLLQGAALLERCRDSLRCRPCAIVTDIDGTLSEIAATPDAAIVTPDARAALERLATFVDLVGVVTGRSAEDGERLIGLPNLLYVGNHGLEQRFQGNTETHADAHAASEAVFSALTDVRLEMEQEGLAAGLIFENKRLSGSIHYRLAPDSDEAGRRLRAHALASANQRNLRVTEGRYVVELRPSITVNKGTAIADLVQSRRLRGLIFLGDDLTDVDAFRVIRRLSDDGQIAGCVVAVASAEMHLTVLNEADGVVDSVERAVALLTTLADDAAQLN